jgi:NitT/TauT family transport system permease protein
MAAATTDDLGGVRPATPVEVARPQRLPSTLPARVLGYLVFLGTWQLLSTFVVADHILPSPVTIVQEMARIITGGDFLTHFGATMQRTLISLPLVFVIGAAIGIAMGLSRWWESFFRDFVTVLLSLPGLIIVLVFILIMGLNPAGPVLAIVVTNFAFVTVQVWEGVKSLPRDLTDMATAFDVSRARRLRHVILPALSPFLFTAFTYAFTLTWKLAMLSELFGASRGVGFKMRAEFWEFNVAGMLSWALLLFVIALAFERLVLKRIEAHVLRWRAATFA